MCSIQCGEGTQERKVVCDPDAKTDNCDHFEEEFRRCSGDQLCGLGMKALKI